MVGGTGQANLSKAFPPEAATVAPAPEQGLHINERAHRPLGVFYLKPDAVLGMALLSQ